MRPYEASNRMFLTAMNVNLICLAMTLMASIAPIMAIASMMAIMISKNLTFL